MDTFVGAGGLGTGSSTLAMCRKRLTKAASQTVARTPMLSRAMTAADASTARAGAAAAASPPSSQELGSRLAMGFGRHQERRQTCNVRRMIITVSRPAGHSPAPP